MKTLQEFSDAILFEAQYNNDRYDEQMKLPANERVAKGVSMVNCSVEMAFYEEKPNPWCKKLDGDLKYIRAVKVMCEKNISKFKEGSSVILSNGKLFFDMDIAVDEVDRFILVPNDFNVKHCFVDVFDYPKNNWEINETNSDISTKILARVSEVLSENEALNFKINSFLNGELKNDFENHRIKIPHLNDSQNNAYLNAINASDFCIIQGPPGTGKTETISNIVKYYVDKGMRVFVTAPTHTAINNCLNAIGNKIKDPNKVVKIGDKVQNKDLLPRHYISQYTRFAQREANGIAIGATAYSLCYPATKRLDGWEFDVAVIDEASQLSIPLSMAAMLRTDKWIFVGDHKQLDPIIPKESNSEMFAESIFSRIARMYPNDINLLNVSYRLNSELIRIPNALFYDDKLYADNSSVIDKKEYQTAQFSEILNDESHILLLHNTFDSQGRSPYEASLVADLVKDLLLNGVNPSDMAILTPYRAHVREVKRHLHLKCTAAIPNFDFRTILVDTVDRMQGQERDYIIYSMSNSNPLESMRRLDFFYSPNRLNVAITRAIKKCFVIANYKIFDVNDAELRAQVAQENIQEYFDIFAAYYKLSRRFEMFTPEESEDDDW